MTIQIGKLKKKIFTSDDGRYHIYQLRCHGGEWMGAVYKGDNPPKALKTVNYQLTGYWENHPRHGKTFIIENAVRAKPQSSDGEKRVLVSALKRLGHTPE